MREDREEVPLFYEGVDLARWALVVGWGGGLAGTGAGIWLMIRLASSGADVVGALLAAVGGVLLVAVVRCRRHESVVGRQWLKGVCGPFRQELARGLIHGLSQRPASGWRRLYAGHEVVIELASDAPGPVLPSAEPEEFVRALR